MTLLNPYTGNVPMPAGPDHPYGVRPETQPHKLRDNDPDVTWEWGQAYPCATILDLPGIQHGQRCHGKMQPGKRCFRYEGRGRLWRRFTCDRCGRRATDWKTQ